MKTEVIVFAAVLAASLGASIPSPKEAVDGRVIGGSDAPDGIAPYQVSLTYWGIHLCGGTIVNERWIVSAAHCFLEIQPLYVTAVAGTNRLSGGGEWYPVNRIISHPQYNPWLSTNDIALLKVSKNIVYTAIIQPAPIQKNQLGAGAKMILTGWGSSTVPHGPATEKLQILEMVSITNEECAVRLQTEIPDLPIVDGNICAYTAPGRGACQGDSGGPLVSDGRLAGVVSWGLPCAEGVPDVFTRVSVFASWIQSYTGPLP